MAHTIHSSSSSSPSSSSSCGRRIRCGYGVGVGARRPTGALLVRPRIRRDNCSRIGSERRRRTESTSFTGVAKAQEREGEREEDDVVFEAEQITKQVRAKVQEKLRILNERTAEKVDLETKRETSSTGDFSSEVEQRLKQALSILERGLIERGPEARLVLLAACCGEHLLLIGPPGTAKSEVARRLGSIVSSNAMFFQRVLTRFSVPEELFGPLSLQMLEQDVYRRNTEGYLPEAEVAFIDEVFKANSAVLNALLMILNEKRFDNGNEQVKVPLVCLVGASNELPTDPELQALYDRFLFRKMVNPVSDYGIQKLLSVTPGEGGKGGEEESPNGSATIEEKNLESEWLDGLKVAAQRNVEVPSRVIDILARLRSHLMQECEPPIYISDRRLLKCINMLKMCAFTNGRTSVSEFDTLLLKHVCWSSPSEQGKVEEWLLDQLISQTETKQLRYLLLGVFTRCCKAMNNRASSPNNTNATALDEMGKDIEELVEILASKLASMRTQTQEMKHLLFDNIWLCEEEADLVTSQLEKPLESSIKQVEALLVDALTVETSFKEQVPLYVAADLLPEYWSDFIRKGNIEDVKPLGIKPLP